MVGAGTGTDDEGETMAMNRGWTRSALWAALLAGVLVAAGCGGDGGRDAAAGDAAAAADDPELALIAAPKVDDLYAAELSAFSTASFEDREGKLYGLLKVVEADGAKVVVITENAASEEPKVASQDILGDLSNIEFDEEERIDIVLPELRKAWDDGRIYEVRRR